MTSSLFERVGGAEVVYRLVAAMYDGVLADPELQPFFQNVQLERLRKMQFEFIASALDGPVGYSGAELQAVHAGRGITAHHFARFVGHLASAMEREQIDPAVIDQMLGRMAMLRDRIVGAANVDG
jgi:hemoglobin